MPPDAIGSASVKFETSCAAGSKDDFNKAVALLHSFWFPEAIKAFEGILARRPGNCAMAHWGIALSQWGNPFAGIKPARHGRAHQGGDRQGGRRPGRRRRASARTSRPSPSW